jgi:hypothetical protein
VLLARLFPHLPPHQPTRACDGPDAGHLSLAGRGAQQACCSEARQPSRWTSFIPNPVFHVERAVSLAEPLGVVPGHLSLAGRGAQQACCSEARQPSRWTSFIPNPVFHVERAASLAEPLGVVPLSAVILEREEGGGSNQLWSATHCSIPADNHADDGADDATMLSQIPDGRQGLAGR